MDSHEVKDCLDPEAMTGWLSRNFVNKYQSSLRNIPEEQRSGPYPCNMSFVIDLIFV